MGSLMWAVLQQLFNRAAASDEVLAVLVAGGLSFLGWLGLRVILPRAKIAWGISHQHAFLLQNVQQPTLVYTGEIWVQNVGRARAEGIEIILAAAPNHFDVWPQRNFSTVTNPNGNLIIKFDDFNRREYVTISMFQPAVQLPLVTNVRWSGGMGKQVPMGPHQLHPAWLLNTVRAIVVFGLFSILYFLFRILTAWFA